MTITASTVFQVTYCWFLNGVELIIIIIIIIIRVAYYSLIRMRCSFDFCWSQKSVRFDTTD